MTLSFILRNRRDEGCSRRDSFSKVPNRATEAKPRFYGNNWEHFTFNSSLFLYVTTDALPLLGYRFYFSIFPKLSEVSLMLKHNVTSLTLDVYTKIT